MMFPRTIKNSLTKKVLSVSLIGCITVTITAAGMQPFLVYASVGSGTLRGIIIGVSALLGTSNINPASINYLNNNAVLNSSIESVYNGTITAADIDAAISGDLGLARWAAPLSNNQQQVSLAQQYISAAGGDPSSLNGVGRASVGQNLKAYADYYYEHGELKPAFGGQTITDNIMGAAVMQSMADVAYNFDNVMWYARENGWTDEQIDALFDSGAAFGDLQSAIDYVENLDKTINKGLRIDTINDVLNVFESGSQVAFWSRDGKMAVIYITNGNCGLGNVGQKLYIKNFTNTAQPYKYGYFDSSGRVYYSNYSCPANDTRSIDDISGSQFYWQGCQTVSSYSQIVQNPTMKSPDIITQNGQAQGTWTKDNQNRNIFNFNILPQYNPQYNYTLPDETIINNYIQDIQDAVNNGDPQEDIGQYLKDLIEEMKHTIPQPTEAPYPTMSPSTIPVQPTEAPKPTNTPEQEQQNTTGMATPELAEKFPFCIPFDLFTIMSHFTANRSAPYIDVELDLGPAGVHHIELDFSVWDSVAALLRLLELIVFIAGLALAARRLIGAGGD